MGAYFGIPYRINPTVFKETKLSELISLPVDSLEELVGKINNGELELWINPYISDEFLTTELSLFQRLIYQLILFGRVILTTACILFAVYTRNYWWLCLIPSAFIIYWFSSVLIPFRKIVSGLLFTFLLSAIVIFQSEPLVVTSATLLLSFLWTLKVTDFKNNQLLKTSLQTEEKFVEMYFRNVILVSREGYILNSPDELESFINYGDRHTPPLLKEQDRLVFCKQCHNRAFSQRQGIVCGLTSAKPGFEYQCPDFLPDEKMDSKVYDEYAKRYKDHEEAKDLANTAPDIMSILAISLIVSESYHLFIGDRLMVISSGFSDWLIYTDRYNLYLALILPSVLLIMAFISRLGYKWAYLPAITLYGADMLLSLFYHNDLLSWYLHIILLGLLIISLRHIPLEKYFSGRLLSDGVYSKIVYEINQNNKEESQANNPPPIQSD